MIRFVAFVLPLPLALAACGGSAGEGGEQGRDSAAPAETRADGSAPEDAAASAASVLLLSPDGEGLRLIARETGSARPIPFGEDRADVEKAVGAALSKQPQRSNNPECPAGAMSFSDYGDVTLNFQDDDFVGWSIDSDSTLSTMDGIAIDSSLAEISGSRVVERQQDSSLGEEVLIGPPESGITALLDGPGEDARVTNLWAGVNCVFR